MKKKYGQPRKTSVEFAKYRIDPNNVKLFHRRKAPHEMHKCSRCEKTIHYSEYGMLPNKGWFDINGDRRKWHYRNCDSLYQKERQLKEPWRRLYVLSRRRAKRDALPFDLTLEYIQSIWPKDNKCPVIKKEFLYGIKNRQRVATLDKIKPDQGYVKGNVVIVSHMVNAFKSDITDFEFFKDMYNFYKNLRK